MNKNDWRRINAAKMAHLKAKRYVIVEKLNNPDGLSFEEITALFRELDVIDHHIEFMNTQTRVSKISENQTTGVVGRWFAEARTTPKKEIFDMSRK